MGQSDEIANRGWSSSHRIAPSTPQQASSTARAVVALSPSGAKPVFQTPNPQDVLRLHGDSVQKPTPTLAKLEPEMTPMSQRLAR